MSLLHKALKKAEVETKNSEGRGSYIESRDSGRSSTLVNVLAVIAVLCLGLAFVSLRTAKMIPFLSAPEAVPSSAIPQAMNTPLQIAGGPGAGDLAAVAQGMIQTGRYQDAREKLERVVLLEPRNAEAYNNLGFTLKKLGKSDEALEQYRKALSITPDCVECLNNLGVLQLSLRQLDEAETQFKKVLQLKPDFAEATFHLALLQEARGDRTAARGNYQKYLDQAKGVDADFLLKIQQRMADLQK